MTFYFGIWQFQGVFNGTKYDAIKSITKRHHKIDRKLAALAIQSISKAITNSHKIRLKVNPVVVFGN